MENRRFGVIVKVHDLARCRAFYRDALDLGEPFLDSSFCCGFALPSGLTLALQLCPAAYLEHESSATAWVCGPVDVEKLTAKLRDAGCELVCEPADGIFGTLLRGMDPEGNVFYLQPFPKKELKS